MPGLSSLEGGTPSLERPPEWVSYRRLGVWWKDLQLEFDLNGGRFFIARKYSQNAMYQRYHCNLLLYGRGVVNIRKSQVLSYHAGVDAGDPEEEPATGKKSVININVSA